VDAELLAELRQWIELLHLSKLEVFGLFVVALIVWRLPVILNHRNERYAIKRDFEAKAERLRQKLEREQLLRLERTKKREKR
jgi:CHASE1-domain containing sensor protein